MTLLEIIKEMEFERMVTEKMESVDDFRKGVLQVTNELLPKLKALVEAKDASTSDGAAIFNTAPAPASAKQIGEWGEQNEYVIWDSIDGDFHDIAKPEDSVRYVRDNYTEGNEMHPDFSSFIIYKKVGEVQTIEENDIVTEIKYIPI